MGLLKRVISYGQLKLRSMLPDSVGSFINAGFNDTGVTVTEQSALAASAVYACCQVIGQAVASLPVHIFSRADGVKDYEHPVYRLLAAEPNEFSTSPAFREAMMLNACLWGNCYAFIERDNLGVPIALYPLASSRTRPIRKNGELYYETLINNTRQLLTPDQVFHVSNFSLDGITGISPIQMAKQSVGLSLAMEKFAAKLFSNGGNVGGILTLPQMSKEAADHFVESWRRQYVGLDAAFSVAVLKDGFDFKSTTIDPEKSQMTASRVHQVREVARIYRVPLHMLGDLEKSSYSSIEAQAMDFYQNTVAPWIIKWEAEAQRKLLLEREKPILEVKFNMDAMLRASTTERYQAYMTGRQAGFLTTNEIRRKENLPPIEGGDVLLQPLNMAPQGPQGGAAATPAKTDSSATDPAVRSLIGEAVTRVLTKEVKALTRAAKKHAGKPEELRTWATTFYATHESLVARAVTASFRTAGVKDSPHEYAKWHCTESLRTIVGVIEGRTAVEDLIDDIETIRPGEIVDSIFGGFRNAA